MNVVIPMYKVGQNIGGFILTEESISSLTDRFFSIQKILPVLDGRDKKEIGKLTAMEFRKNEKTLYFHITLEDKQYKEIRSRIETFCEVKEVYAI